MNYSLFYLFEMDRKKAPTTIRNNRVEHSFWCIGEQSKVIFFSGAKQPQKTTIIMKEPDF